MHDAQEPLTLILLPGMDGTGELFDPFLTALGHQPAHVVRYPGDDALDYAKLEAVAREALPSSGPFVILGESFSGPIAIALAASSPERLKGLVLCTTFARNPRPSLKWLHPLIAIAPVKSAPVAALCHFLLGHFTTDTLREALVRALSQVSSSALRARLASVLSVDVSHLLAHVQAPILYLSATQDRVVPASASELIAKIRPQTRVARIDAPHFLLQAAPNQAAPVVHRFLQEALQWRRLG